MNLTPGTEIPTKSFSVNRELLVQYANASGDQNPIHQNEEFAKSVGLPNVIAHGMFTMGLAGKYLSEINGRDRKSTRLNSSHSQQSRMPSSA